MDCRGAGNSQRPQATRVRLGLIQNSRLLEFQRHSYLMMELSWRLPMFCMLSPEDFIREVRKILPYEQVQIIQVLQELENRLDSAPKN